MSTLGRLYTREEYPSVISDNLAHLRPMHLAAGMAVLAEYAQVEAYASALLTHFAEADGPAVAAIYGVLRQGHIQSKALLAVAQIKLDLEDFKLLKKLLKIAKFASDARDVLAHHMWAYDEQFPKDVVLVSPEVMWKVTDAMRGIGGAGAVTDENAIAIQNLLRENCLIWTPEDLENARLASVYASVGLSAFGLMYRAPHAGAARATERQKVENTILLASQRLGI